MHQYDYKQMKFGLFIALFVDCMIEWVSCRKHSGGIWDKAKLQKVHKELER